MNWAAFSDSPDPWYSRVAVSSSDRMLAPVHATVVFPYLVYRYPLVRGSRQFLTYSTARSMTSAGTSQPTFLAARRDMICQAVTLMSASTGWIEYRHPASP